MLLAKTNHFGANVNKEIFSVAFWIVDVMSLTILQIFVLIYYLSGLVKLVYRMLYNIGSLAICLQKSKYLMLSVKTLLFQPCDARNIFLILLFRCILLQLMCMNCIFTLMSLAVSLLWPPCVADVDIIFFALWLLCCIFFSHLISAVAEWMSTILRHMVWP